MCKLSILDWFSGSQWEETDYASDQHEQSEEHCSETENDDDNYSNDRKQIQWQEGFSDSKIDDETLEEEDRVHYGCSDGDRNSHEGEDYDAEDEDTDESDVGDDTESEVDTSDKDVAVSETVSDKDDVKSESDSDKDVVVSETVNDKDDVVSESSSDKDVVVSETDSDKDVAELETGNGKADSESVTVSDKDDAESETGSDKDVTESETVSDKDVAESETVSDKDVAESKRDSDKDDDVSETVNDTVDVVPETVGNKIDEQPNTVRAEEKTLNVHTSSEAALAETDKRLEENEAQKSPSKQTEGQSCIDSENNVVVDETAEVLADKGDNEGFDEAQRHISDNPERDVVQAQNDRINSNMEDRRQEETSGNSSTETKSEEEYVRHGSRIQPQHVAASPTNRPQPKSEEKCVKDDNLIDISMNESPPEMQSNMIQQDAIATVQKTSQPELSLESIQLYKRKQLSFASIISKSKSDVVVGCSV